MFRKVFEMKPDLFLTKIQLAANLADVFGGQDEVSPTGHTMFSGNYTPPILKTMDYME